MNIWMIGESLMKQYYLKKTFYSNSNLEHITDPDYMYAKRA